MKNELILTLCYRCKTILAENNRLIRRNDIKYPCDICKRMGYEYKLQKLRGGESCQQRN